MKQAEKMNPPRFALANLTGGLAKMEGNWWNDAPRFVLANLAGGLYPPRFCKSDQGD